MDRTTGERAIRTWSGAAAAAVAGLFVAGAVLAEAGAQEPQTAPRRERQASPLSKQLGIKVPERTPLPPGVVRGAGDGSAAVQPAAIYTAEVVDLPDAETVVVRRTSTGQTLRVKLFGVTAPAAPSGAAARAARGEVWRGLKGQTVQVRHQTAPAPGEKAAAVATVYLVPASEGGQAAAAAGAPVTGGDRPPVALRPFIGGVDPSGTARDLAVGAPGTTAGTTSATISQAARPLAIPGGLRLTLNEGVIRAGAARWDAREAPGESGLKAAQEDARGARRGLWSAAGMARK